jgi:hypothetical protein
MVQVLHYDVGKMKAEVGAAMEAGKLDHHRPSGDN